MAQSGKKSGGGFMRNWLDRFNNLRPAVRRRKPAGLDRGVSLLNIRPPDSFFPVLDLTESPVKRGLMLRPSSCYELNNEPDDVRLDNKEEWVFAGTTPSTVAVDSQHCGTIISQQQQQHEHHSAARAIDPEQQEQLSHRLRIIEDEDECGAQKNEMTTQSGFTGGVYSLDLWAASLPHIDSDVSDSDDYLPSDKCCPYPPIMNNRRDITDDVPAHPVPQSVENEKRNLAPPEESDKMEEKDRLEREEEKAETTSSIMSLADVERLTTTTTTTSLMDESVGGSCFMYLPGLRHRGRALLVTELDQLDEKKKELTAGQLIRLLAYYHSVPRKAAAKNGLVFFVIGKPEEFPEAFGLIEQLLHHYLKEGRKYIDEVVIWSHDEDSGGTPSEPLRISGRSCDVTTGSRQLRERLPTALSLRPCGGAVAHNQRDWIAFRQVVEPFLNWCRERSKVLYQVISSVRRMISTIHHHHQEPEMDLSSALEELEQLYATSVGHPELVRLLSEGPTVLQDLAAAKTKLGDHNADARETMERCSALYAEIQRSVGRLSRLVERRKAQLEKHLMTPPPPSKAHLPPSGAASDTGGIIVVSTTKTTITTSACRQILSWLCRKGEETLSRYNVTLADSLAAAKLQEREFQRFLNLAQKQIIKGKELLEDLQRDSPASVTNTLSPTQEEEEDVVQSIDETEPPPPVIVHRAKSTSNILELASSLQTQLSKFGHRLDDTRERLEDTSRCYELLDKAYEWGVEAMKLASKLKLDQQPCCPFSVATHLLSQVDQFLADHSSQTAILEDLNILARKLDNPKLFDQCKLAQNRCRETLELLEFRRNILVNYVKEDELQRQEHQLKIETDSASIIYENVTELMAGNTCSSSEDKVDGTSSVGSKDIWGKSETESVKTTTVDVLTTANHCVQLRIKKATVTTQHINDERPGRPVSVQLRGATSFSSGASSYASSTSSWSSRMKTAVHRKITSVQQPNLPASNDNDLKDNRTEKDENSRTEEEEDQEEQVSVCQSPISVNSHLQCRASSIDLSMPIAELQEAGFSQDDIKSQKTLLLIMREMIQTERDYVRSLEYIIENYIPELSREDIPQAMRGKRNVIFGNLEKIYGFHHHYFLRELERCHNLPFLVGQCFLRHEQHFYLYALYNKNKPKSDTLMAEYGTAFFRRKQTELGDKMDLASYLLKPVQRMGKYALLLKQLLKESGDKEPEYVDLLAAEQMVRFQLRHGNDLLAMDSLRDCDVNVKEQGRLLRQSEFFCWQGRKKGLRHVFLFEDLILFSKAKRDPERKNLDIYIYKQSMKTSDIGFTAKMGDSSTRFEIWFRKRKPNETIVMETTHPDVKEAWVEDLSRILWKQALRNRELRMAEMAEMGIGNKPCLDIRPSQDQISDRSISYSQLAKAPKFRHSVCGSILLGDSRSSKRPHSIISVSSSASSSASSGGSGSVNDNRTGSSNGSASSGSAGGGHCHPDPTSPSGTLIANLLSNHRSKTNQSQCSAESGILADLSMSYDDPGDSSGGGHRRVGRSDSSITTESADSITLSPSSPLTSSKSCSPVYPGSNPTSPVSLYVNNKLIPLGTSTPSHKNMPMTEM